MASLTAFQAYAYNNIEEGRRKMCLGLGNHHKIRGRPEEYIAVRLRAGRLAPSAGAGPQGGAWGVKERKVTRGKIGRKVIHISSGLIPPVLAFFVWRELLLALLALGAVVALSIEAARLASPRLNQWLVDHFSLLLKEQERYEPAAATYFVTAALLVFVLFPQGVAVAAVAFTALGDPLAGLVGEAFGERRWVWGKSLEGSLACVAGCLAVGLGLSWTPLGLGVFVTLVGVFCATLVEALPLPVDDNLSIPLASAAAMALAGVWIG